MHYLPLIVCACAGLVAIAVIVARLSKPPADTLFPACHDAPLAQLNKLGASRHSFYRDHEGRWWKRSAVFHPGAGQWFKVEKRV